jgi:predicted restriction endonuclease
LPIKGRSFCSNNCQHDFEYKEFIRAWKEGKVDGGIGKSWINVSKHIRRYLFEKYNSKCSRCGWGEVNPYTNTIPLELEHIDGNAENNVEENLTLLCPNCHSLTQTYKGANKGNGRRNIKWISRAGSTKL